MTDLLFLWHMHQPRYVDPATGEPALPWVRLHGCSGYLDMARALERHPGVRATVNFVPVLVEQLEALAAGARDALERLAERPAGDLEPSEQATVVHRSFSVAPRAIAARPRYAELAAARGSRPFTVGELRDVECLFLLGWLGFAAREDHPAIDQLDRKGRGFTEADKALLLATVRAAGARVLPAWRRLSERGQVELSASPYHHPIVPLLIDTEAARRSRPEDALPPRFAYPGDAREQILRGLEAHRLAFGRAPEGMWAPEGALSPEAVELYRACGVRWLTGDEQLLRASLETGGPAASALALEATPGAALSPAHLPSGPRQSEQGSLVHTRLWRHGGLDLVFRDRDLSDRIGFRYAGMPAEAAVEDLLSVARERGGEGGLVGVFLDGENAWESYPEHGGLFLDALYRALEAERGPLRTRTMSEAVALRSPGTPLPALGSGSWIEGTFRIWIGDPLKNRAWTELGLLRDRLAAEEARRGAADPGVQAARELALIAEASDWFWWFGEPNASSEDALFDALFRAHLAASWRALGEEPPDALGRPLQPED